MIYELRIYECFSGRLEALHNRFRDHTLNLFEKHGMKNVGYWTYTVGPSRNELVYLLSYPDLNARMESWNSFTNDPAWQKAREESEREGLIVKDSRNSILTPTPYSPLQ